jgi:hypothetical protein
LDAEVLRVRVEVGVEYFAIVVREVIQGAEVTVRVKCATRVYKMSLTAKLLRDKSEEKDITRHPCADHLRHARNKYM